MNPNYFNFAFHHFNIPFHPFVSINPYFPLPYGELLVENPAFLVKIQDEGVDKQLKTSESATNPSKTDKSCQKQLECVEQVSIREQNTTQKYNDFNKNVLPNNIHLALSYIRRTNKSGRVVDKIIKNLNPNPLQYSKKKFYSYQNYLKEKLVNIKYNTMIEAVVSHYDPKSSVFSLQEQEFYNKMTRILIFNFLRDGALINVLSSTKITRTKKDEHLKIQRMIMQKIEALR